MLKPASACLLGQTERCRLIDIARLLPVEQFVEGPLGCSAGLAAKFDPLEATQVMAKKARKRKYSKSSGKDVKSEIYRYKRGKAKSGPGGKGGKVKSRKQAIAIGLSKARKKGKKVPHKKK